jgi:hypothetical protein
VRSLMRRYKIIMALRSSLASRTLDAQLYRKKEYIWAFGVLRWAGTSQS